MESRGCNGSSAHRIFEDAQEGKNSNPSPRAQAVFVKLVVRKTKNIFLLVNGTHMIWKSLRDSKQGNHIAIFLAELVRPYT